MHLNIPYLREECRFGVEGEKEDIIVSYEWSFF